MSETCIGPGAKPGETCGRPTVASGLCQAHYRQSHRHRGQKELTPIRQRAETARTILPGVRVSDTAERALAAESERRRVPVATVASDVLEGWARRRK